MLRVIAVLSGLLVSLCTQAATTQEDIFLTIHSRLSYMEDVALYKANHKLAIEDLEREEVVIQNASLSAEKVGLDKNSVVDFFSAQISAAKAIQYRYRADLLSQPNDKTPRDLKEVVRPQLIKLGKDINIKIADYLKENTTFSTQDFSLFEKSLTSPYLTQSDKKKLYQALTKIKLK